MNHTAPASDNQNANGNGFFGKIAKVSPVLVFGAGAIVSFVVSYVTGQQHSASTEAEVKQILVQHEEAIRELKMSVASIVPRSEHEAIQEKQKEIDRLREKFDDNLQKQIDEIKRK